MMRSNVGRTHNEAWRRNRPLALEISWIFLTVFRFTYRIHTVRAPSVRVTVLRETVTQSDCYSDRLLASPKTMSPLRASLVMAASLVGSAAASSLTVAMTNIRESGEFDPKEPPSHTTDVKVGVYLEHLLDVSMEKHTFDMDFYFTLEWMDGRNYRRPSLAELTPTPTSTSTQPHITTHNHSPSPSPS